MSLAEQVKSGGPKILTLDIERFKGQAVVEFWDLGEFKHRRLHPDTVTEWPRTICAAWRWHGKRATDFAAEWDDDGRHGMLERIWHAYDQADIVVGHNVKAFDTKKLKTEWWLMGLKPPRPWKTVDTLTVARREFGMESNTLDAICKRLGLPGKVDRYDVEVARRAVDGDKAAQRRIKRYNVGDVATTEALYDALRGWDASHPHIGLWTGIERSCNQCGSESLTPLGESGQSDGQVRAVTNSYAGYRCDNCGAVLRANHRQRLVTMRAAR